jgi:acetyltransferase-like isoleucine patch superfamily enzyme
LGWKYFIAPSSQFRSSDNGFFKLGGKLWLESGSLIEATGGQIVIGQNVFINRNCQMVSMASIEIGDDCIIANNVSFFDHDHNYFDDARSFCKQGFTKAPIKVGDNVWLGSGVTVLKGVCIGSNTVIAAGSVVTKDIPSGEIWGGVPARYIKKVYSK